MYSRSLRPSLIQHLVSSTTNPSRLRRGALQYDRPQPHISLIGRYSLCNVSESDDPHIRTLYYSIVGSRMRWGINDSAHHVHPNSARCFGKRKRYTAVLCMCACFFRCIIHWYTFGVVVRNGYFGFFGITKFLIIETWYVASIDTTRYFLFWKFTGFRD